MNTQKDMLNKKYLMITALIALTVVTLPNLVTQMFAGSHIKTGESVVIEVKVPEVFVWPKEERELPLVIKFVDEAAVEIVLVDESDTVTDMPKGLTAHIWVGGWNTYVFGHGQAWKEVVVSTTHGTSCFATIDDNKMYKCLIEWGEDLSKKDLYVSYNEG